MNVLKNVTFKNTSQVFLRSLFVYPAPQWPERDAPVVSRASPPPGGAVKTHADSVQEAASHLRQGQRNGRTD